MPIVPDVCLFQIQGYSRPQIQVNRVLYYFPLYFVEICYILKQGYIPGHRYKFFEPCIIFLRISLQFVTFNKFKIKVLGLNEVSRLLIFLPSLTVRICSQKLQIRSCCLRHVCLTTCYNWRTAEQIFMTFGINESLLKFVRRFNFV
jgi:hypothetical protein